MKIMPDCCIVLPEDFDDYEWEVAAKGCFFGAKIIASGKWCLVSFYDSVRLSQEVEAVIQRGGIFFEPNLIVVETVTRLNMVQAAELLSKSNQIEYFFN